MQTPGRLNEPQTPMLPVIERRVSAIENSSILNFQRVESIERGQRRVFVRVISQLGALSKNMNDMRNIIRKDIRDKQKYFKEEQKILKKDSDNLSGINAALFLSSRRGLAAALGVLGISQINEGNTRVGLENIGGAAALLTPEILEIITGAVVNALALRGLLGGGKGVSVGGAVKGGRGNPILTTALLAASLIIPSLMNNQNADKRRTEVAARTIQGRETINKPDVSRFRKILDRFDKILSGIKLENRKRTKGNIDERLTRKENQDKFKEDRARGSAIAKENMMGGIKPEILDADNESEEGNIMPEMFSDDSSGDLSKDTSDEDNMVVSENNNIFKSTNIAGGNLFFHQELLENNEQVDKRNIFSNFSNNSSFNLLLSPPSNKEGEKTINFIDLSENTDESGSSSNFISESSSPDFINVTTKFSSIDLFDSASSYKTFGVFW